MAVVAKAEEAVYGLTEAIPELCMIKRVSIRLLRNPSIHLCRSQRMHLRDSAKDRRL